MVNLQGLKIAAKQSLIGSRWATTAERARWLTGLRQRIRHPELWDLYLEDRRTRAALERLVEPNFNCFDIGAHIGSVLSDLCRFAPDGTHLAIEPSPQKAARLRKNFPQVEIIEAAVSDEPGRAEFFDDTDRPGFSGLQAPQGDDAVTMYDVSVVTLDDRFGDRSVDFIKIDVEGAELPALRGGTGLLSAQQPSVLFECGLDDQLERFGYERVDLFDFLVGQGYEVYSMIDFCFGRSPMTRDSFRKAGTYPYRGFNYLALPPMIEVSRFL